MSNELKKLFQDINDFEIAVLLTNMAQFKLLVITYRTLDWDLTLPKPNK